MNILEETITQRSIKCDCGYVTSQDNYSFSDMFVSGKCRSKLEVTFNFLGCRNEFTYIGENWNTLRLSSVIHNGRVR